MIKMTILQFKILVFSLRPSEQEKNTDVKIGLIGKKSFPKIIPFFFLAYS